MRIVMMGTGPFAVPTFNSLLDSSHQVTALFTRPPRKVRSRKAPVNPMRELAERRGVAVFDPLDINAAEAREPLQDQRPELLVVCDYGQILSRESLALAAFGGINLHASLLPKYRGAAPINWALYHGERETGVTVIHMTPRLDAGPSLVQRVTPIGPEETAVELEPRLARLGVEAVLESIDILAKTRGDSAVGIKQDRALATKAPRLKKEDGRVDWSRTAGQIKNQVRAFKPWPGTFVRWRRPRGEPVRLILDRVSIAETTEPCSSDPGAVIHNDGGHLWIACGDGALAIEQIQPAGKRVMRIDEFLRGHPVAVGDVLTD